MTTLRGRAERIARAALDRLRRGRRIVLWTPPRLGVGNHFYFWLWAQLRRDRGEDAWVLEDPGMAVWLREFPSLRHLTIPRRRIGIRDRRHVDFVQHWGGDYSAEQLHAFAARLAAEPPFAERVERARAAMGDATLVVNVRRGDYYADDAFRATYGMDVVGWIRAALPLALASAPIDEIRIISDDLDWCRRELGFLAEVRPVVYGAAGDDPADHLAALAWARALVLANSTFSYWGAHLHRALRGGSGREVVAPRFHGHIGHDSDAWQLDPEWQIVESIPGGWDDPEAARIRAGRASAREAQPSAPAPAGIGGTQMLEQARRAKHAALVARRRWIDPWWGEVSGSARGALKTAESRARGYRYEPDRYVASFLHRTLEGEPDLPAPRRLFLFWTGENELPAVRRAAVDALRELNSDLEVALVTPATLDEWIVPDSPLHPAYPQLCLVHRSDYLRAYFMHHHGGAYADIKRPKTPAGPAIDATNADPGRWATGYPEIYRGGVASPPPAKLAADMSLHYRLLLGSAAFVFRPRTPFTAEWLFEADRRLDYLADRLAAAPGDARGSDPAYPVPWLGLLAEIIQPLSLKYRDRIHLDPALRPTRFNYR